MNNRRNYYRILHVQPEAPAEIIKASYRSLMTKLNVHPDRGGDHESAVLINQAYTVLSDPQKRKKYDELLLSRNSQKPKHPTNEKTSHGKPEPSSSGNAYDYRESRVNVRASSSTARRLCSFCGNEHAAYINKYCTRCDSPLSPIQSAQNNRRCELLGRRTVPRIAKMGTLTLYPSWPHTGYSGQLHDLSISGLSIVTTFAAKPGQIIKLNANFLKAVARVLTVRSNGASFSVHASFLASEFVTNTGVFVTEKA
jgi:curved DNA-binding protein CbpA